MISRRQCLFRAAVGACVTSSASLLTACHSGTQNSSLILSASADRNRKYWIGAHHLDGETLLSVPVAQRAHGMLRHPVRPELVYFFARRPGTELHRINLLDAEDLVQYQSAADRHFYGHGCFSEDGQWLFCTENDFAAGRGVISVRDANTLKLVDEFPSHGVGPHELKRMPGTGTLVIANGGLLTHPSEPRKVLNLTSMASNLAYVDSANGALIERYAMRNDKLSIRHIDVSPDGRVALTTQDQLTQRRDQVLVALHAGENQLVELPANSVAWEQLGGYCGSVAVGALDSGQTLAVVTSPRGNSVMLFDMLQQQYLTTFHARDVCGVGFNASDQTFVATSSLGLIYQIGVFQGEWQMRQVGLSAQHHWDNHLVVV